ncbi:MAG TPA: sigma 54-interacting transcriptional regulator [Myxococcaceae bacterium]|nr:sigma 54-interacting transcriptional regulator [Myxococcaceae bacterium]
MPELVFFRRGEEVLRFSLDRARVTVGRGEQSDLVIPDPEVSRLQAAFSVQEGRVVLEDLSGRGTVVSGAKTARAELNDGADIALGQWRAVFRQRLGANGADGGEDATDVGGRGTEIRPAPESPRLPGARLRVLRGGAETTHPFPGDVLTVGQDPGNDVRLDDRFVSGKHLRVTRKGGGFRVLDLGSTNGTFLGPIRIHDAEVPPGTALRVGEVELVPEPSGPARAEGAFEGILGRDPAVRQLAELIERVAPSSAAVAVLGESGTGKELVARALHARGARASGPFIPVNCAAISKELIESELFGHEKGAFTGALNARKGAFEEAEGGTLFLDEIGELPSELQPKLLRVLESGEIKRVGASRPVQVDVRVVAATHRDLQAMIKEGTFREDLYYRLCVVPLHLPPLRSRRGDVVTLAEHFLKAFTPRGQSVRFTPAALERLQSHLWPGNVRELRNVVHRGLLLRRGPMIDASDLSFDQEVNRETGVAVPEFAPGMTLEQMLDRLERQIVESALRRFNNNRERVAKELGVARSTLFKRLKDWGLTRQDEAE